MRKLRKNEIDGSKAPTWMLEGYKKLRKEFEALGYSYSTPEEKKEALQVYIRRNLFSSYKLGEK